MTFKEEADRIYMKSPEGVLLAEVTFPEAATYVVNIAHTFVDDSLRGQGVAGKLMAAVAEKLRREGKKARLTCPYAIGWFPKHPEYADILVEPAAE